MSKALLLSSTYVNKKAVLKFYHPDTNTLITYNDDTGHQPWCYVTHEDAEKVKEITGIKSLSQVEVFDVLKDKKISIMKLVADDPLVIGGKDYSLRESYKTYEADIKYYSTYLYDRGLIVGRWYNIENNVITPVEMTTKTIDLKDVSFEGVMDIEKFKTYLNQWVSLLDQPIPHLKRLAIDIEVESKEGSFADPLAAMQRVTAISFESTDLHKVYVLKRPEIPMGNEEIKECEVEWFDTEKEMLDKAFRLIESYPIVLTYNGDMFDMPYLHNRAIKIGFERTPFKMMTKNATLHKGIHLDMYGFFSNRSMQVYTFNSKYSEFGLEPVSAALLGEHKLEHDGDFDKVPLLSLAKYCYNDSRLTYKLSSYNDNMVMNIIVTLSRISNMPIDDITRMSISHWIKSMIYFKHRQNNELIPRADDFPQVEASTKAMIEGKKYEGAIVLPPEKGIHFDVTVMDFASLYPSIIKTKNLSYETVRCPHEECKKNMIPQTQHWACTKKIGTYALLLGTLKEVRVAHFKKLMRNETDKTKKEQYDAITQTIKVFLVSGYGVVGFSSFPLYFLPTAEAVTAYGRDIIVDTANHAKSIGMNVIAGDTDSMFTKQPTKEQISALIEYVKHKHNMDLEADKEYRYVIFSNRKKNYFGVKKDGSADIKGLTGKKSHTPPFVKNLFTDIVEELKKIYVLDQFEPTKKVVTDKIKVVITGIDKVPLEQMAFRMKINMDPSEYKSKTQIIKAAELLGKRIEKGQFVSFVKTWTDPGVKPVQIVQRKEVDIPKYLEALQNTLVQITDSLEIDFDVLMGRGRKTTIEEFL